MQITVLGAGSWGTTVASILTRRDHESLIWARNPECAGDRQGSTPTAAT